MHSPTSLNINRIERSAETKNLRSVFEVSGNLIPAQSQRHPPCHCHVSVRARDSEDVGCEPIRMTNDRMLKSTLFFNRSGLLK